MWVQRYNLFLIVGRLRLKILQNLIQKLAKSYRWLSFPVSHDILPPSLACLMDIHYQPHLLTKVFFYDDFDLPSPFPLKKTFFHRETLHSTLLLFPHFAPTESATLPIEQRTRAVLFRV